jgi:hypothetical protein
VPVVLALTLGLSGCIPESRLYLGLVNGQLVIKTCEAIEASGVDVSEVTPDSDSVDGDVMWKVSGHATLNVGDVIVVGRAPAGMVTDVPYTGDISPTSAYGVSIARDTDEPSTVFGSFQGEGLEEGRWLRSGDPDPIDSPC